MKSQKIKKRIFMGLLLLTLFFIPCFVYADDVQSDDPDCDFDGRDEIKSFFGIKVYTSDDDDPLNIQYKITMSHTTASFKVYKINDLEVDSGDFGTLSKSKDMIFYGRDLPDEIVNNIAKGKKIKIRLKSNGGKGTWKGNTCKFDKAWYHVGIESYQVEEGTSTCDRIDASEYERAFSERIKCEGTTYTPGSFEDKFCQVYKKAKNAGGTHFKQNITSDTVNGGTLACDYNVNNVPKDIDSLKGDAEENGGALGGDYFVNKQYFYRSKTTDRKTATYIYSYNPADPIKKTTSCTRKCQETVTVEYGPPVAKKAGLCFSYKVRVTSRVNCYMDQKPNPPSDNCSKCVPYPHCVHEGGKVYKQGGPNEDYDSCVQSCDGGKYTKKCSEQCYNEVYGDETEKTNVLDYLSDLTATKTAAIDPKDWTGSFSQCVRLYNNMSQSSSRYKKTNHGCYIRNSSGTIKWKVESGHYSQGRWYASHSGRWSNGNYDIFRYDGFWRHDYGHNNYCHDDCSWRGCKVADNRHTGGKKKYLNPETAKMDYKHNMGEYIKILQACNKQPECSTQTSTYKILTKYTDEAGTTTNKKFPTDETWDNVVPNSKDRATSTYVVEEPKVSLANVDRRKKTTLKPNFPTNKRGTRGCYSPKDFSNNSGTGDIDAIHKSSKKLTYRTTWGYPGTWMNPKTGEISYQQQSGTPWREYEDKFCIPFSQKSVNANWWNAYYNKHYINTATLSVRTQDIKDKCLTDTTNTIFSPKAVNGDELEWNINAYTENFGFLKWKFHIKCFYATNKAPTINTDIISIPPGECSSDISPVNDNVRIRSIDLANMFPALDGTESQNKNNGSAGRTTGFNWSQYATQTKNTGYKSEPVKIIKTLQDRAKRNQVYVNDRLDYQFVLTPKTIRDLRGDGSNNYTDYDANNFYLDSNGVLRYYSNKIRNNIPAGSKNVPEVGLVVVGGDKQITGPIRCNNMERWNSSNCDSELS